MLHYQITALIDGGAIYFEMSKVEMHNTVGINSSARNIGKFGVITMNSKFQSNYMHIVETEGNFIVFNNSDAEMRHTYLSNRGNYCPILGIEGSQMFVDYVYFTNENQTTTTQADSKINESIVCMDSDKNAQKIVKGIPFLFLSFNSFL